MIGEYIRYSRTKYGEFVGQNRDRSVHQIYEKVGYQMIKNPN